MTDEQFNFIAAMLVAGPIFTLFGIGSAIWMVWGEYKNRD